MHSIVLQLKQQNKDLKEKEIEGLLYLLKTGSYSNNELIRITGLPKETLKHFKLSFSNYLAAQDDLVSLNEEGIKLLDNIVFEAFSWSLVTFNDVDLQTKFEKTVSQLRPKAKREYDQWFATIPTTIAKMKIMHAKGLLEGKTIALLGDDDLLSVCIMLSGIKYARLSVYDIDARLTKLIVEVSKELNCRNVFANELDFRTPLPENEIGQYDVVVTDPPYTYSGVRLFLDCASSLLKNSTYTDGYIYLYYGNSYKSPEKTHQIQKLINEQGFVIEDKIDKFARYEGAESIGSASSLYILKNTSATAMAINTFSNTSAIYTADEKPERKFPYVEQYVCKIYNIPVAILDSQKALLKIAGEFCKIHDLKVVKTDIFKFKPFGFSITILLSNSNLNIHTWREYGAVHIDLITCVKIRNGDQLVNTLASLFNSKDIEVKRVE